MQTYTYKDPFSHEKIAIDELNGAREGIFLHGNNDFETWIRKAPRFLDDPDQCGIFPPFTDLEFKYRQPFVISKKNVLLTGVRTTLDRQGWWFNDQSYVDQAELHQDLTKLAQHQNAFLNEWTGFQPTENNQAFTFKPDHRMTVTLRGRTLVVCSLEPDNYGSWLFRILPKLHTAMQLGLQFDRILVEGKHKRLQDYFDLIGIDRSLIAQHDRNVFYNVEHALIPSLQNSQAYLDQATQAFYSKLRARYGLPCMGEKIYISRSNHTQAGRSTRVMLNEKQLIENLSKIGFRIVCPELLSLRAQIETFSSASVVIGPSGSAMFNAVFCHPCTKLIDIESEPHWIHAHTSLFSSLGLDYNIFVGKVDPTDNNPVHKRWMLNIPAFMERVHSII